MPHLLLVALLLITGGAAAADPAPIGRVDNIQGWAYVERRDGSGERLQVGSSLHEGDRVRTDDSGGLGLELADQTVIAMGKDSKLRIDEFVLDPAGRLGSLSFLVAEGTIVTVSGLIAKIDPDAMVVNTPGATLGIRGTQFGVVVNGYGSAIVTLMTERGDFVGEIVVQNQSGVTRLYEAHQTVQIGSNPNVIPVVFPSTDLSYIQASFGAVLRHLSKSATSANPY